MLVAKLEGTTGTGDGTDMTVFLFCVPNTNSLDRLSLAVSSEVCLLLGTTAVATVAGFVGCIGAPNVNPPSAGVATIFVDADKSLSFAVLVGLTPNENAVAMG